MEGVQTRLEGNQQCHTVISNEDAQHQARMLACCAAAGGLLFTPGLPCAATARTHPARPVHAYIVSHGPSGSWSRINLSFCSLLLPPDALKPSLMLVSMMPVTASGSSSPGSPMGSSTAAPAASAAGPDCMACSVRSGNQRAPSQLKPGQPARAM